MVPSSPEPERSKQAGAARPKVIYVMGSGRCGSTILGVTLGNCEGMFFVGELDRWLPSNGVPVLGGLERTRFWSTVRARVDVDEDLIGPQTRDSFERGMGPLRVRSWSGRRRLQNRYRKTSGQLYEVIAETAGATHIVESSHFPLRAQELKAIDGIEVYLIFLVRHPQAVLASFTRTVKRNDAAALRKRVLTTNADLWLTHLLSMFVFLRHRSDRRMFLNYEDFTGDPRGVLQQVLDMSDSPASIPDLSALKTGWPMGGNRLLRSEVVALKPETPRPTETSLLTAALQMPLTRLMSKLRPAATVSTPPEQPAAR